MNAPRPIAAADWAEANRRDLMNALARVRHCLENPGDGGMEPAPLKTDPGHALGMLCERFGLSSFERDLLLLCAGMELDGDFPALIAETGRERPDFALALAVLPGAHWSALTPAAPLRHWRLLELDAGESLVRSPLRIDERILHFLAGVTHLDERLEGFVIASSGDLQELAPSQQALAERLAGVWAEAPDTVVQLAGTDAQVRQAIANAAATRLGMGLYELSARVLPAPPQDLDILIRLWRREAVLGNSVLLIDCDAVDPADQDLDERIGRFIDQAGGVLLIGGGRRRRARRRPLIHFDVQRPSGGEQQRLWQRMLGPTAARLGTRLPRLISQFDLDPATIRAACEQARAAGDEPERIEQALWDACRQAARPGLDVLARRIEPVASWERLILPEPQTDALRAIAAQVRQRAKVHDRWGFAARGRQGLGLAVLFAGASGTGKTLAAEVLANELRLDLYRIDLSQVVSKYIGETEKNLRRVFDAAEAGGVILLFDEADALFGKRSEVKDSHDRYANIEVSYLLQRMESYRGLAILTTNLKSALDEAFLRRLRFIVQFPFPDSEQRAAIWRQIYPAETPTEDLDWARLAQLSVTGGNIRNIALNAAFLAAEQERPVGMQQLLEAARLEYAKLERPLTEWGA